MISCQPLSITEYGEEILLLVGKIGIESFLENKYDKQEEIYLDYLYYGGKCCSYNTFKSDCLEIEKRIKKGETFSITEDSVLYRRRDFYGIECEKEKEMDDYYQQQIVIKSVGEEFLNLCSIYKKQ